MIIMMGSMGCSIGTKEKYTLVISKASAIPEAVKGVPIVATNNKVKLTILNKPNIVFEKNIGGYVVVDQDFYKLLIESYKDVRSNKGAD